MQRYNNPIATLASYIERDNFAAFKQLFDLLHQQNDLIQFNLHQRHDGKTLYQLAFIHQCSDHFSFLLERGFSEKLYQHGDDCKRQYMERLVYLLKSDEESFIYWFDLLRCHQELLDIDIQVDYEGLTLLQHAIMHQPALVQRLIDAGCDFNLPQPGTLTSIAQARMGCIAPLLALDNVVLTAAICNKLFIVSANYGYVDIMRQLLNRGADVNAVNALNRSALGYAAEADNKEIVTMLLLKGAIPLHAVQLAIAAGHVEMVELLLFHGAGLFQDLPATFLTLAVNANHCYIEGMKIGGVLVTHQTQGCHAALLTIPEVQAFQDQQNSLDCRSSNRRLPYASMHRWLNHLENHQIEMLDNSAFIQAIEGFKRLGKVSSLKFLAREVVYDNRFIRNISIPAANLPVNLFQYIQLHPVLSNDLFPLHPDRQQAIAIIYDRNDELLAFRDYVKRVHSKEYNYKIAQEVAAGIGFHTSFCAVTVYGFYVSGLFAFKCGASMVKNPLTFIGIPGFVTAGIATVSIMLYLNYARQYGCANFCYGCDGSDKPIRQYSNVAAAVDALIKIMRTESLPLNIEIELDELLVPTLTYNELMASLRRISDYYQTTALERIRQDRSQTPYQLFSSARFFWSEQARQANRNNTLPPRVAMNDDARDVQHYMGHGLFEMIASPQVAPLQLHMEDNENNEGSDSGNEMERVPLRHHSQYF